MPLLLDLATELLQQIIDQVYHNDLVNLASTCRHINKLSQSALQRHQKLLSEYSVVSNVAHRGGVLAELTAKILRDPHLGLYVSRLKIDGGYTKWSSPHQDPAWPAHNEYPKDTMRALGEAGAIVEVLFKSEIYTWLDSFQKGDEDAVLALLLLKLPNLETLFLNTVEDCKYSNLALGFAQGGSDQYSVILVSDRAKTFDTLQKVARIPSVRVIKVVGNRSWRSPMLISPVGGKYSLNTVMFNNCRLASKALHSFIENISGLRCFSWVSGEYDFVSADLYWIRVGISTTARYTLEYLQIRCKYGFLAGNHESANGETTMVTGSGSQTDSRRPCLHEENSDPYIGSLRNFKVLKTLILNWEFLVDNGRDSGRNDLTGRIRMTPFPARQLPSSICNLMLTVKDDIGRRHQSSRNLETALKELLNESKARLPNLKILIAVGMSRLDLEQLSASTLVKNYQSAGIALSFIAADDTSDIDRDLRTYGYYNKAPWAPRTLA